MTLRKFEMDGVRVVLEREISKDGKIFGLKDWAGKTVTIVIQNEEKSKRGGK